MGPPLKTTVRQVPIIDRDACIGCGVCISICPDKILHADHSGQPIVEAEFCMQCGHCYAVCPTEAVAVPFLEEPVRLASVDADNNGGSASVSPLLLLELMKQRRSCRLYQCRAVDRVVLEDLVRAAITAPSGTNSQGWKFLLLPERDDVIKLGQATAGFYRRLNRKAANPLLRFLLRVCGNRALDQYFKKYYRSIDEALHRWDKNGEDLLFHGAPAAIVVAGDSASSCPAEDALLASQNILLMAEAMGLGCCLIGFVVEAAKRDPAVSGVLNLDKAYRIHSVVAVGYPAVKFIRPAGRKYLRPEVVKPA